MHSSILSLIKFIRENDGIGNKPRLVKKTQEKFHLVQDRSVYYSEHFAIRFCYSSSKTFSNTVVSLSKLQKYDDLPFIVCLVTPKENVLYLANTTFLTKISHSSQELRVDNIRGSINGSDIVREFNNLKNSPENFEDLFQIHAALGFAENLSRLVEATNNITPSGKKLSLSEREKIVVLTAPERAISFISSTEYSTLKLELDHQVEKFTKEIFVASFIENVNIRGRIIEYLIVGENEKLKQELIEALNRNSRKIPRFKTSNDLADYTRIFEHYNTATDVKTKIMVLNSNPKAYNIDKLLEFLSKNKSVFMFYFIGIEPSKIINQVLISIFQKDLLQSTILLKHWSGRNSRGVAQFEGKVLNKLINQPDNEIDLEKSVSFLESLIEL